MAYKQRWSAYFELLDVDKSGYVDLGDLAHASASVSKLIRKPEGSPEVIAAAAAYKKFFDEFISAFDTDKDGKVSREELLAGVEKQFVGKPASDLPEWWVANPAIVFRLFDTNDNGVLSKEEVVAAVQSVNSQISTEDIKHAYDWVIKQSPTGKFDPEAYSKIVFFQWATSPDDVPEVNTLTPYLRPF